MVKHILGRLRDFFLPPSGTPMWVRVLPYVVLGVLTLIVLVTGAYAWDYTNSPSFCGTTCHTMPPEYAAYSVSPHARVDCVECHIGKSFIATRITRKAGDFKHVVDLVFSRYEYPIHAGNLRPARDTCELCHSPEKFSDDSLREIKRYSDDEANTAASIYLIFKTGGGSRREGLGKGIHWHIENPIFYLPLDTLEQKIPYVRIVADDGLMTEYVDIESDVKPETVDPNKLKQMDCITCHNRITHFTPQPEEAVDGLLVRGLISTSIPDIRRKAVDVLRVQYASSQQALDAISELTDYYQQKYPDFYTGNGQLVKDAVTEILGIYSQSIFHDQKVTWDTHPSNIGHEYFPGCMRCHDGKHLNAKGEAIRLECNLCHSVPVVAGPDKFVANIEISRGPEPKSHTNPNWINLHRNTFDLTCAACHKMDDAGGTSNTSFCSNSACHGSVWKYVGFDAPALREIMKEQLKELIAFEVTPAPKPAQAATQPSSTESTGAVPTYADTIGVIFLQRCSGCHSQDVTMNGLSLTTYQTLMTGGIDGPAVISGDPENSLIVKKVAGAQPHFAQLTPEELDLVKKWIAGGAQEGPPAAQVTPTADTGETGKTSWQGGIQAIFLNSCVMCHSESGMGAEAASLTSYQNALIGSEEGAVIIPGNSQASPLVQLQSAGGHSGQLTNEELTRIIEWINAGAPEK